MKKTKAIGARCARTKAGGGYTHTSNSEPQPHFFVAFPVPCLFLSFQAPRTRHGEYHFPGDVAAELSACAGQPRTKGETRHLANDAERTGTIEMPPTKYQVVSPSAGISCHAWNADKSSESWTSVVWCCGCSCVHACCLLCLIFCAWLTNLSYSAAFFSRDNPAPRPPRPRHQHVPSLILMECR